MLRNCLKQVSQREFMPNDFTLPGSSPMPITVAKYCTQGFFLTPEFIDTFV